MSDVAYGGVLRDSGAALNGAVPAWGNPAYDFGGAQPLYSDYEGYQGGVQAIDWDTPYDPQAEAFAAQIAAAAEAGVAYFGVSAETTEPEAVPEAPKRGRGRPRKSQS